MTGSPAAAVAPRWSPPAIEPPPDMVRAALTGFPADGAVRA